MNINFDTLKEMLEEIEEIQEAPDEEPNFFDVGGKSYLENPTSDLLALFMGKSKHVKPWLGMALVACLAKGNAEAADLAIDWTGVTAEREVPVLGEEGTTKFLDIVIGDGSFVIGIENKVFASSHYNPFSDYDRLLEARAAGGPVLKCILQAYPRVAGVQRPWPIVTYAELVEKALDLYGKDVATCPPSKWQFFYQELLLHLKQLSNPARTTSMPTKSTEFVIEHFAELQKASRLLESFQSDLSADGVKVVTDALSTDREAIIKPGTSNWDNGNIKALRFFPTHWGGQSQVVIYYQAAEENVGEGSMIFCVCAYIDRPHAKRPLEEIEAAFIASVKANTLPESFEVDEAEDYISYESSNRLLCLDCYPTQQSRSDALTAVADLAKWVQKNAFTNV